MLMKYEVADSYLTLESLFNSVFRYFCYNAYAFKNAGILNFFPSEEPT